MDKGSGLVHHMETTAANTHDVTVVAKLLYGEEVSVHGDSGYLGAEKREDAIIRNSRGQKIRYKINRIAVAILVMQEQEDTMTPVLKKQLQDCEAEIRNVMKAIRMGIITESTKDCLENLEMQRDNLNTSILQLQLERCKFTKEEIVDWISRYKYGNINDPDYRREIIDIFVNSVYVYDDKIVFTYNYKDGSQTMTLQEIEAAFSSDLESSSPPKHA